MKKSSIYIATLTWATALLLFGCTETANSLSSNPSEDNLEEPDPNSEVVDEVETPTKQAPQKMINEQNYNSVLTEAEIAEDLTEVSEIANIDLDLGSNLTMFRKKAKKILAPVSEECYPLSESEEYGTQGSGEYYFYEMKYLNGSGEEVTSCNIDMNNSSINWNFVMTDITEYGDSEHYMTMDGKIEGTNGQTLMTVTFSADFEGYEAEGGKRVDQWGDISMQTNVNQQTGESSMTYAMNMNLHFLEDMYRCSFDMDWSISITDSNEEIDMEGLATHSCDLIHGGTTVGKIEWDEYGSTVYDLDGNEV